MSSHVNIHIRFFLRKRDSSSNNQFPIYARLTVDNLRKDFSLNRFICPERWDSNLSRVKGTKNDAKAINKYLDTVKTRFLEIANELILKKELVTADMLVERFFGRNNLEKTVIEVFKLHNDRVAALIGKDFSASTYTRFLTTLKHVEEFLAHSYKAKDIPLSKLNYEFITDFEYYLKFVRNNSHNTAIKYIRNFRKIIKLAINNDWIDRDPFAKYSNPLKEVKREFLTIEELKSIEQKQFNTERLNIVRDIFVFCCYTGLAYTDVKKLTPKEISKGNDGELWLFTSRQKTGTDSHVPLLPKAVELINKYTHHPKLKGKGIVFPVNSNQKMNAYLSEIADLCGVKKKLTMHIARHTFGTQMLTYGVSIESVSSMLGHKNIKTTQHYSKIVREKVSNDMKELKSKMKLI
jgi:site-specific recombinase XerD